jgi:diaminopropionate ammonia-lyase
LPGVPADTSIDKEPELRSFFNNGRRGTVSTAPSRTPLEFHPRLPGYKPTPLIEVPRVADELRLGAVWVKVEADRLGLPSFKILGASWAVYRALDEHTGGLPPWKNLDELRRALDPYRPLALAAATDGNHGRAVAGMAALLGLDARIFVPAGTAAARIDGILGEGASCEVVDGTYDDAVGRSAEEASEKCLVISDTSWPGYENVPRWVIEGYSTIFWEIEDELSRRANPRPDAVVIQLGVGALGAAAARHFRNTGNGDTIMIGVEPQPSACVLASMEAGQIVTIPGPHDSIMAGLNCGTPSMVAWPDVSAGFDLFTAVDDDSARRGMRMLAAETIEAGETGAAGIAGLIEICSDETIRERVGLGAESTVLTLCTEGATDPRAYAEIVGRSPGGL